MRNVLGMGVALAALAALPCLGTGVSEAVPLAVHGGGDSPSVQALRAHAAQTSDAILASAPESAWRALDPDDTLYMTLPQGRLVIELAPRFAPRYVANIRKLVRQGFFDGLPIFRVQDDGVVEWGDPTGHKSVGMARRMVPAEFERQSRDLPFTALPDPDTYAAQVGFSGSFPAARDPVFGRAWLVNCYGMVGAARGNNVDSGGGTALYAVIGGPQRQWDRNTTMVGRVVAGMPLLSTLPRGNGPLGVYLNRRDRVRVESAQIAADLPRAKRTPLEVLRTDTPTFTQYVESLRNRQGPWFKVPAGRISVCAIPIPVRPAR